MSTTMLASYIQSIPMSYLVSSQIYSNKLSSDVYYIKISLLRMHAETLIVVARQIYRNIIIKILRDVVLMSISYLDIAFPFKKRYELSLSGVKHVLGGIRTGYINIHIFWL